MINEIKKEIPDFHTWAGSYLLEKDKDKAAYSTYAITRSFEKNVYPIIGNKKLNEISSDDIRTIINLCGRKMSRNSVWAIFRKVRQILKEAKEEKLIDHNPCDMFDEFTFKPVNRKNFSNEELSKIENSLNNNNMRDLYRLAFACTIRLNEMLVLQWKDVDLENRMIVVSRAIRRNSNGYVVHDLNERKFIYLTEEAASVLEEIRNKQTRLDQYKEENYVLCDINGEHFKRRNVMDNIALMKDRTGIEDFNFRRISTYVKDKKQGEVQL